MEMIVGVVLFVSVQMEGAQPAQRAYPIEAASPEEGFKKCDAMVQSLRHNAIEQLAKKQGSWQASCVLVSEPGNPA